MTEPKAQAHAGVDPASGSRTRQDDAQDAALSLLAAPLTIPHAAGALLVQLTPLAGPMVRLCETGPWGTIFDRLTWLPWLSLCAGEACCLFVSSSGEGKELPLRALPPCPADHLRVVMVSDTHGKHRLLRLPAGDILVHAGDILSRNACVLRNHSKSHPRGRAALQDFNEWLGALPYQATVVIGGNHDATLEDEGDEQARALLSNAHYLRESAIDVGGLCIYGTPWSQGRSQNAAFQTHEPPAAPPADVGRVDVLVSHCHDEGLAAAVRPVLYVSGHAHEQHGVVRTAQPCVAVNASICDRFYRAVHLPAVCDVKVRARRARAHEQGALPARGREL